MDRQRIYQPAEWGNGLPGKTRSATRKIIVAQMSRMVGKVIKTFNARAGG
jgi:hypothetical protein